MVQQREPILTKNKVSIAYLLVRQPFPLSPVSPWSMKTKEMVADQGRANEACCDQSAIQRC